MSPHSLPPDDASPGSPPRHRPHSNNYPKMSAQQYWDPYPSARRILFLEAYDSFSNNILSLLKRILGHVSIYVLRMDLSSLSGDDPWTKEEFLHRLQFFDAVVCGPGPGTPLNEADVGAFNFLWSLPQKATIPVLGICLGFQSLVAASGGRIRRLRRGMHGMVRDIDHCENDMFAYVPNFKATLYHSLCADIGQDDIREDLWEEEKWKPSTAAPDLVPLAWVTEKGDEGEERILMGVRHRERPFWGLQYHPESVCTDEAAQKVIVRWFDLALQRNEEIGRIRVSKDPFCLVSSPVEAPFLPNGSSSEAWHHLPQILGGSYTFEEIDLPSHINATTIVDILSSGLEDDSALLDASSSITNDPMAKNSVIALGLDTAPRFKYRVFSNRLTVETPSLGSLQFSLQATAYSSDPTVWTTLTSIWQATKIDGLANAPSESTFKGGFMGFITYEAGLEGLTPDTIPRDRPHQRPDICLAWVTKSVVLSHQTRKIYIQNISADPNPWITTTIRRLTTSPLWATTPEPTLLTPSITPSQIAHGLNHPTITVSAPDSQSYTTSVLTCQSHISAGSSYELCLTAQTTMTRPSTAPWTLYKSLRAKQPAPFGSYIRLGGCTLLSASPERFLRHDDKGNCSMRPMKGTVRKSPAVNTLAAAEKILHTPKEEAENLMIVDLVMHDLHAVCGPHVQVAELLKVEEYATVYQMVTVIKGTFSPLPSLPAVPAAAGLTALGSMLPPGSMTGAPKKRSCEILAGIERRERGLYSGVVGYFDVTGQADWSVTIRAMFRWDDECGDEERWNIGAGGAVTTLSTPEGETEEMYTKLCGPLGVFVAS